MNCPYCGSNQVQIVPQTFTQARYGFIAWSLWIFFALFTAGLLLIIPLLTNREIVTHTNAVCMTCGHNWRLN